MSRVSSPRLLVLAVACASCTGAIGDGAGASTPAAAGTPTSMGATAAAPAADTPKEVVPGGADPARAAPPRPFAPLGPYVYVAKVKTLMTGQAVTDDDIAAVQANPKALATLVDRWRDTPQFRARMFGWFQQAFQQVNTDLERYTPSFGNYFGYWTQNSSAIHNFEESFARTVVALVFDENRPFTEVVTTDRFMLTPALMYLYTHLDNLPRNDDGNEVTSAWWPLERMPGFNITVTRNVDPATGASVPIALEETVDPTSPHFLQFYDAKGFDPATYKGTNIASCIQPQVIKGASAANAIFAMYTGSRWGDGCGYMPPWFTAADFQDWRMVRVRQPNAGEDRTFFWDLPRFRNPATRELVLNTPRIGFMTTPAFFANWPTNVSNASRVITNQALIVGLGRSFDDSNTTISVSANTDTMHAAPGTVCYACHQVLDPMRDLFRQSFNLFYYQQLSPTDLSKKNIPATGTFAVEGAPPTSGSGVGTFARAMATHPRFAVAWTQKLCTFANSAPCVETDPPFQRVAAAFRQSNHDFKVLVRELFSSPLVTFTGRTDTFQDAGYALSIERRDVLCNALEQRLGVKEPCGLTGALYANAPLARSVPGPGYGRAEVTPVLPRDPNLFFASATANLCTKLAPLVVDAGASSRWQSARKDDAVADFVHVVMDLAPSDPRAGPVQQILADHYAAAVAAKATPRDALQSTFLVACTSPYALGIGL